MLKHRPSLHRYRPHLCDPYPLAVFLSHFSPSFALLRCLLPSLFFLLENIAQSRALISRILATKPLERQGYVLSILISADPIR